MNKKRVKKTKKIRRKSKNRRIRIIIRIRIAAPQVLRLLATDASKFKILLKSKFKCR
jgi:hypothetical protein